MARNTHNTLVTIYILFYFFSVLFYTALIIRGVRLKTWGTVGGWGRQGAGGGGGGGRIPRREVGWGWGGGGGGLKTEP